MCKQIEGAADSHFQMTVLIDIKHYICYIVTIACIDIVVDILRRESLQILLREDKIIHTYTKFNQSSLCAVAISPYTEELLCAV